MVQVIAKTFCKIVSHDNKTKTWRWAHKVVIMTGLATARSLHYEGRSMMGQYCKEKQSPLDISKHQSHNNTAQLATVGDWQFLQRP